MEIIPFNILVKQYFVILVIFLFWNEIVGICNACNTSQFSKSTIFCLHIFSETTFSSDDGADNNSDISAMVKDNFIYISWFFWKFGTCFQEVQNEKEMAVYRVVEYLKTIETKQENKHNQNLQVLFVLQ